MDISPFFNKKNLNIAPKSLQKQRILKISFTPITKTILICRFLLEIFKYTALLMSICWKILKIVTNFPKDSNENLQFLKKYGIIKWEFYLRPAPLDLLFAAWRWGVGHLAFET